MSTNDEIWEEGWRLIESSHKNFDSTLVSLLNRQFSYQKHAQLRVSFNMGFRFGTNTRTDGLISLPISFFFKENSLYVLNDLIARYQSACIFWNLEKYIDKVTPPWGRNHSYMRSYRERSVALRQPNVIRYANWNWKLW